MSDSIGKVTMDLETNYGPFQQQLNGIAGKSTNMVKTAFLGLGKVMAGVFAVTKLVQFGKASIDLASNLAEVQNVVDVVFGESSSQINNFAKNALNAYGLSELSAKRYASTMGAMLKSMGLTQNEVLGMSQSITALTGDMASFYNLDSDTAFQKIRAGISGETEPLKQLGINMSVANMEAFALSQGITKSYQSMTQSEQALLRYNYLLKTTADAQGDFSRTSNSWANQTRILSEQWNSLKATLGSAFIALLTPVVRVLNLIISKLQIAAAYFRAFVEAITGVKQESSNASSGFGAIADSATEAGDATVAAANKASKALAGFDRLNVLSQPDNSDGGDVGSSLGFGSTDISIPALDTTPAEVSLDKLSGKAEAFLNKLGEIASWAGFDKFQAGIEKINFSVIVDNFASAFKNLTPIAESSFSGVLDITKSLFGAWSSYLGGVVSVYGKYVEIASGGIAQFLESQSGEIASWITQTANTITKGYNNISFSAEAIFGSFWEALDSNQVTLENSIANTLTVLTDMSLTVGTMFADMWLGLTEGLTLFLADNQALIDEFFNGLIETTTGLHDTVTSIIGDMFKSIREWWESDGKTVWNEIVEVFFDLIGWVTELWNDLIKPVLDSLEKELGVLWDEHLKPLWDKLLDFITSVWNVVKLLYDTILKPVIDWIMAEIIPIIADTLTTAVNGIMNWLGDIIDATTFLIDGLQGVLDFLIGVFTGDWAKAWEGIKRFFVGVWNSILTLVKSVINSIIGILNTIWTYMYGQIQVVVNGIGSVVEKLGKVLGKDWNISMPKNNIPKIPYLAEGGIINQPTLAMVGEAGKEAVVPLENTAFADSIANAILRVLTPLFTNGSTIGKNDDGTQVIVLKVGEYELGRITVGAINKYHNIVGKVELEV